LKIHPNEETLDGLLRFPGEPAPEMLRHLKACARCRTRLACILRRRDPATVVPLRSVGATDYDPAFERSLRAAAGWELTLERERREAAGLFNELAEHSPEQREILLRNCPRFHAWGLLELLVERSLETTRQDPVRGEELGQLAVRIAGFPEAERYGAERIRDLRARAWAHVGNARRVRSDLEGAEAAFTSAWSDLEAGTRDLFERAILLDLTASLRRDQRRFEEASRLLRRAVSLFLELGERHRAGRSLVNRATVHHHAGHPEQGIPLLHQALELIDPQQEPRLLLCAGHNLVFYLASSGRFLEARRAYRAAGPLYRRFPDAWTQNRRVWVKGKIARGLGQLAEAESMFLAARDGFLAEGIPYDTALVSLELALLYAEQGRAAELKRLAGEMVPVFASRQIHREALAALAFFRQAVEAERAGVEVVGKIAEYLRKARHSPELRFPEGPDE
jgi:tetratricopeptide (TPR) repeat protein